MKINFFQEFQSTKCLCGKEKEGGHSFCYADYRRLPPQMRRNLYRRFGSGYELAFEDAARHLGIWPEQKAPEPSPRRMAA
jgi:hypothetical protein